MSTIQRVRTQFESKGAEKVAKDTDRVGKAQTRLGQASASAGRQFSAQADGLGGLVGAYAGAAANIFAITAAFTALNRAARAEQTIDGLNRLAATFGQVGNEVLGNLERITKGQLSLAETAQQANIALSAGLGPQLEGLTAVSLKASRALGRNLTDAFQRVVRGAGKLEPELLDELGIFARIDPAVEKYALQTGKTASSLTNFERRQAFANAVLEEGARKFATVNTTVPTTAEKLEKLGATIANIGQQLGAFLADYLAPVADFISNNMSAAVIAIGLLLRQLFGRALSAAGTAFEGFINRVSGRLSDLSLRAQTTNQAFQQATSNIAKTANQINPGVLFGGKQAKEGADVIRFLREGGTISPADAQKSAAALRDAAAAQTKFAKSAEGADERAKAQQRSLNSLANQLAGLEAATNRYGLAATKAFNLVNAAALKLKATVASTLAFGNKLLVVVGIVEGLAAIAGQIFDKNLSPIGAIAGLISEANQESKKFAATLGEITVEIAKTVNTAGLLPEQIAEAAADSAKDLKTVFDPKFFDAPLTFLDRAFDDLSAFELETSFKKSRESLERLQDGIEDLKKTVGEFGIEGRKAFVELQIAEEIEKVLIAFGQSGDSAFRLLSRVANQTGIDGAQLFKIFQDGIVSVNQDTKNFEATIAGLSFSFADFKGQFLNFGGEAGATLLAVEANLRSFTDEFERGSLNAEEAGKRIVALETQLGRVSESINAALLQDISTITTEDLKRLDTQKLILAELENQLKPYNDIKDTLVTLEKLQKDLKSTLSSDIKEFEKAALTGLTGPFGFAEDQLTATKNQLAFQNKLLDTSVAELDTRKASTQQLEIDKKTQEARLNQLNASLRTQVESLIIAENTGASQKTINEILEKSERLQREIGNTQKEIDDITADIAKKNAGIQTREAIIRDITSARLGSMLKLSDETTKLARAQQRAADAAKDELDILILRNRLNERNRQISQDTAVDKAYIEGLSRELQINEALSKLSNAQNELAVRKRQIEQQTTEALVKQAEATREILRIRGEIAEQKIEKEFTDKLAPLAKDLQDAEFFTNLYTEEQRRKLREEIIILERDQQLAILDERKRQADEEYRLNLDIVNARIAGADKAIQAAKDDAAALEQRQRTELSLFDQRKELERQQAQRQINRIQDQRDVFTLEKQIADTQARAQLDRKLEGIEQTKRELSVIEETARVNDAFIQAQGKIIEKYAEIVNAQLRAAGFEDQEILVNVDDFKTASADTIKRLGGIRENLQLQQNRAEDYYSEQLRESTAIKESREALNRLEEDRLQRDLDGAAKLAEIERSILLSKQELATAESQATIENAKRSLEDLQTQKTQLLENKELRDITYQNEREQIIQNAQDKLDALARERDTIMKIKNIAAGVVIDTVTDAFMDFNTALIEGNLTFKNIAQGFRDMVGNMLKEIQAQVFRQTIAKPIAEGIGSLFLATGGKVRHMAAGGSAMKRDRVATMLEPGEFVIRKEAAKKLGMSKLQELNAGIGEDKLARVIAFAMGSKVKQKAGGGKILNAENAKILDFDKYDTSGYGRPLTPLEQKLVAERTQGKVSDVTGKPANYDNFIPGTGLNSFTTDMSGVIGDSTFGQDISSVRKQQTIAEKKKAEDFRAEEARRLGLAPQQGSGTQSRFNQRSLDQYGLGARGFNPLALLPGGSILSQLVGDDFKGIGYKDAPRPSTQKEAMELEKALAGLEEVYGVRPTRMRGSKLGDIDPVTGGLFGRGGSAQVNIGDAIFGARGRNGTTSFTNSGAAASAIFGTEADPGFAFRRTPLSVAEYNAAGPLGRARFNPSAYGAFGGQRAISVNQALQLNTYGGYRNEGGGYTIPSGTFSGTIRDRSTFGGDRPDFDGSVQSSGASFGGSSFNASRDLGFGGVGFAAGGLVRLMAGGGSVNSRDRVPALLEPGEFVIRRPMAKAIGGPALNQMNATGVAPNIAVNVNNQGVPKDVAVSAPRMNGDKVILDIITRDMRNNGAIRKSLRGNR